VNEVAEGGDRWDALADSYGASPVVARLAKALVDVVGVAPGELVLDLGTGTGLALIAAADAGGGRLVGVDRSFRMLKVAADRVAEAAATNVALVRADAARLPVPDATFDLALAASVWQFLGSSPAVLSEWRRVLRPGGRLGFSVPGPGSGASIPADLRDKYSTQPAHPAQQSPAQQIPAQQIPAQQIPAQQIQAQTSSGSQGTARPSPALAEAATAAGFSEVTVLNRTCEHILPGAEDWWALQWTHGMRFFLETLEPDSRQLLKGEALERLERRETGEVVVTTNTLYCVCRR
jgi:SAM-dependent methyltransferase